MFYSRDDSRAAFKRDVERLYRDAVQARGATADPVEHREDKP
jgi:hypothetical protein